MPALPLQAPPPVPISDAQLQDWLQDTVGWQELQISAGAFHAAQAHPGHVRIPTGTLPINFADEMI